jgi:hypothetical protein
MYLVADQLARLPWWKVRDSGWRHYNSIHNYIVVVHNYIYRLYRWF